MSAPFLSLFAVHVSCVVFVFKALSRERQGSGVKWVGFCQKGARCLDRITVYTVEGLVFVGVRALLGQATQKAASFFCSLLIVVYICREYLFSPGIVSLSGYLF